MSSVNAGSNDYAGDYVVTAGRNAACCGAPCFDPGFAA